MFSGLVSGALGLIGTGIEAANQRRMQELAHQYNMEETEHAAGLNYMYNEMAANNADERARAQFNDLYSPEARVNQLKEAGLSVGLMYGMGGTVGQGQAQGAQGAGAAGQQGKANAGAVNSLGIAQILSTIRVNESIANKNNAEADTQRGENERGSAEINNIKADTGLKRADTALKHAQENLINAQEIGQELANAYNTEAYPIKLQELTTQTDIAAEELERAIRYNEIGREIKEIKIEQFRADLNATIASTFQSLTAAGLNEAQIKVAIATCDKIAQEISESRSKQGFWKAQITQKSKELRLKDEEIEFMYKEFNKTKELSTAFHNEDVKSSLQKTPWGLFMWATGALVQNYGLEYQEIER